MTCSCMVTHAKWPQKWVINICNYLCFIGWAGEHTTSFIKELTVSNVLTSMRLQLEESSREIKRGTITRREREVRICIFKLHLFTYHQSSQLVLRSLLATCCAIVYNLSEGVARANCTTSCEVMEGEPSTSRWRLRNSCNSLTLSRY